MKPINIIKRLDESDGWIAFYKGNKVEISKDEANSLYGAKQVAIQKLNVPKSKVSELAIEPAYNDDNLDDAPASNAQFEAANPDNEEKNKIIRQALTGPKSFEKNRKALKDIGLEPGRRDGYEYEPGETIYLHGTNGKVLSVDPDGTNVWKSGGSSEKHYKKELEFKNRHSKNYNNMDRLDFNSDEAKSFDYYNYLTKPNNEYQDEVDSADDVKGRRDNKGKKGYNLPDEALTPEEKSLNKRPRKYLQLKKDREDLETELKGYDEVKKKLDKTNKEIEKLHGKKNESNLKESRYSEIEENDPVLDKTIKVYDINALLDKELKPSEDGTKYESYDFGTGAAIILKPDGTGCVVDYEAVGTKFNSESEIVDVYLRPNETEVDGHRAIYVMPTAKVQLSIDELLKAPSKEVKVRDFFTKWDYNDRCASNFRGILPYLRDDKITEAVDTSKATDIEIFTSDYEYPPDIEPEDAFRNSSDSYYFTVVKNERDAERFNYHSDYWGSAEQYQNDNVGLVSSLGLGDSDDGEDLFYFEDEDGKHYFTITGVAIDRQYNSISHTKILIKEVNNINEAIEQKYDKSNPDYNSFLRDVKHYTGSYDYEFGGKVSTECYGQPITVQYFYWNRPYVGGGYNTEVNVLTPMNSMAGDNIQEAIENAFEKNSRVKLSQKEVKQKILDAVADLDKED